ncbi:MAG: AraC family transcriptional regulator [Blautia sp.]|nr:AraC family transcriptional regulator [Blautia sp.]
MNNHLFQGESVNSNRILYTPSEFARTNLFYLQEIGSLQAIKPHISSRRNLMSYLFFYINSGSGILNYDGKDYAAAAGDCVFINCQTPYFHQSSEDLWSLNWIHFYGPTIHAIYLKYVERGGQPVFQPGDLAKFSCLWDDLYHLASSNDYIKDMKINENLFSILTLIMDESWNPDARTLSSKQRSLIDVKEYLDSHYTEKISLDDLSGKFLINKYYLERIFKEQFGTTIISHLLNVRITHAKQLLRFTDKSVEQVGVECGIYPLYYFSRIFKQTEGVSPVEYRRRWG